MKSGITFTRVWHDDDLEELKIDVCDGTSSFANNVYCGKDKILQLVEDVRVFQRQIHGGILDSLLGAFGPEYANGAFHIRLHFRLPSRIYISCHQQSDYYEFSICKVANEARLYLVSEPILLEAFRIDLSRLSSRSTDQAFLECLPDRGA